MILKIQLVGRIGLGGKHGKTLLLFYEYDIIRICQRFSDLKNSDFIFSPEKKRSQQEVNKIISLVNENLEIINEHWNDHFNQN